MRALFTSLVQQFSAALADEGSKFQHFIESLLLPVAGGKNGTGGIPGLPVTHPLWKLCDNTWAARVSAGAEGMVLPAGDQGSVAAEQTS